MIKKIVLAVLLTLSLSIVAGCHTVHGIGQDIESGGKAIQKTSGQ